MTRSNLMENIDFTQVLTKDQWDELMETGSLHLTKYSFHRIAVESKINHIVVCSSADDKLIGLVHINIREEE